MEVGGQPCRGVVKGLLLTLVRYLPEPHDLFDVDISLVADQFSQAINLPLSCSKVERCFSFVVLSINVSIVCN